MPTSFPKSLRFGALLSLVLAPVSLLCVIAFAQDAKKPAKIESAGKKFKNIKVLKDLPADQLIPLMHNFNESLGVKCNACHVINADHTGWEKDDKELKVTARTMILLVNDLNKHQKSIKGKATCFLCHHGNQEPQTRPAAQAPEKKE